jgi:radical SAM superfamily enzyme YgiQ (UPF0313 family)
MNYILYARQVAPNLHPQFDDGCFGGCSVFPSFPNKLLNAGMVLHKRDKNAAIHTFEPVMVNPESADEAIAKSGADAIVFPVVENFEWQMIKTLYLAQKNNMKAICVAPTDAYGKYLEANYPGLEYLPVPLQTEDSIPEISLMSPFGFAFHCYIPNYQIGTGCPYKCNFCVWPKQIQAMKQPRVAVQDLSLIDRYCCDLPPYLLCSSLIHDDTWLNGFAREKLAWLPNMTYTTDINPMDITPDRIANLKVSGCTKVIIGIESANNIIRKEIHKVGTIEQVQEKLDLLKSEDIEIQAGFLYNLSAEEDAVTEIEFIKRNPNLKVSAGIVKAYIGSELYDNQDDEGWKTIDLNGNPIVTNRYLDTAIENLKKLTQGLNIPEAEEIKKWHVC